MQENLEKDKNVSVNGPLVSVIIPTYNRSEYIGDAIESVLAQTFKDYEIIIVDDGSTIDVKSVLEPYRDHIRYIYQENKGLAAARNTGMRHSRGRYLAFLDDDDLFEPRKLECQVPILEEHPEIGLVYSDAYFFEATDPSNFSLNLAVARNSPYSEFAKKFFMNTNISVSAFLTRRQCFDDVGLFDESISTHADSDMILRIALEWPVRFSDYPSTKIRHHPVRMSLDRIDVHKCILNSNKKIFRLYPEFKLELGKEAEKKNAESHYFLTQAYIRLENWPEAKKELERYFSSCPHFAWKARLYKMMLQLPQPALFFHVLFGITSRYRHLNTILQKYKLSLAIYL